MRQSHHQAAPLVRVRNLTQQLSAGIAGACTQVRMLDHVNFDLHPAQLLVLAGEPGSGDGALLNVLNGDRRGVTGQCQVAEAVSMQRARISAMQAAVILSVWPVPSLLPRSVMGRVAERTPVPLLLLDIAEQAGPARDLIEGTLLRAHEPVQHWVRSLVLRGGAAVLVAGNALGRELALPHGPGVRVVTMVRGRFADAPTYPRRRATFHSRSRHSGPRSADLHSARACQSFASSIPSVDK